MFTFILFLLMSAVCFGIYTYFLDKIALLRKQNMLLINQNNELRRKLRDLVHAQNTSSADMSIIKIVDTKYTEVDED